MFTQIRMRLGSPLICLRVVGSNQNVTQVNDVTPGHGQGGRRGRQGEGPLDIHRFVHQIILTVASETRVVQLVEGTRVHTIPTLFFCFESCNGTVAKEISRETSLLVSFQKTLLQDLLNLLIAELGGGGGGSSSRGGRGGRGRRRDLNHGSVIKSLEKYLIGVTLSL